MIRKSKIALIAAAEVMGIVSPAFAQSRSTIGGVLPTTYDAEGKAHFYEYGYSETAVRQSDQIAIRQSHDENTVRQNGLHAFAMITHDARSDSGYNSNGSHSYSVYDPGIETQR